MGTPTISTRFPVCYVEEQMVVVIVGLGTPSLGEQVSVYEPKTGTLHENYYVTESEVMPANEVYESITALYNCNSPVAFVKKLSAEVGTDLPMEMPITVYVLTKLEDTSNWNDPLSL